MQNLTQIGNQTFYHAPSNGVGNLSIDLDKTAIIVTQDKLSTNINWIKNQLKNKVVNVMVVGEHLNDFVPEIQERNVLLFAVNSFSEGVQLAVKSHRIIDNVICFCDDKSMMDFSNISEE